MNTLTENFTTSTSAQTIARSHYNEYNYSHAYDLFDVYESCSRNKFRAMEYCKDLCNKMNGYGLKILSHNSHQFTVGFEFPHPTNGNTCFAYITKAYNRYCEL